MKPWKQQQQTKEVKLLGRLTKPYLDKGFFRFIVQKRNSSCTCRLHELNIRCCNTRTVGSPVCFRLSFPAWWLWENPYQRPGICAYNWFSSSFFTTTTTRFFMQKFHITIVDLETTCVVSAANWVLCFWPNLAVGRKKNSCCSCSCILQENTT